MRRIAMIVELKNAEIAQSAIEQAIRYNEWGKSKFEDRVSIYLIGYQIEKDALPRLEGLKSVGSGVSALIHEALFRIV